MSTEPELSILEAIRGALFDEMARDERSMVLGMDVGLIGGAEGYGFPGFPVAGNDLFAGTRQRSRPSTARFPWVSRR